VENGAHAHARVQYRAPGVPGCPRVHKNADDAEVPGDTPSINDIPADPETSKRARARARRVKARKYERALRGARFQFHLGRDTPATFPLRFASYGLRKDKTSGWLRYVRVKVIKNWVALAA
jgi:hypothetical protein